MSSQRQTIHSIHNKKFWTEFFHLYESLPALWDTNNPLYKNRQFKCDAYDIMVDKMKEIEPRADREDVLRKINIFRTNFRRECSRINTSLQEGRHYHSTLWYFDLLCFLQTGDKRRDRKRKIGDDGEKSIMRKRRCNNMIKKSDDKHIISPKKDNIIEYEPRSTHEFQYDLEEETDFDYVTDKLGHPFVDSRNDDTTDTQQDNLALNNYQDEEEDDDEDDQSYQNYSHQEEFPNYTIHRNIRTNNKKINLTTDSVSQVDEEIITNESPIEVNSASEDQQVFNEYTADNETETAQWCIREINSPNIATLHVEKTNLHVGNAAITSTNKFRDNASTKFVRDVKTMTSNSSQGECKLSESSEILAKSWAVQYDELNQDQKLLARKAINDILFEGCMGHLAMGLNGRVIVNSNDYTNHGTNKVSSNEEVESSDVYEQSTIIASLASSTSGIGSGQSVTITTNVVTNSKDHTNDGWLKLG